MNDDKDMHDGLVTSCDFVIFLYLIMNAVSLYVCKKMYKPDITVNILLELVPIFIET